MTKLRPRRHAVRDAALAFLRDREGFPASTGEVAREMGMHLVDFPWRAPQPPRPQCWPDDLADPGRDMTSPCHRCNAWHRPPVWRNYQAEDVRPLLQLAERDGLVERVVVEGERRHFWRSA